MKKDANHSLNSTQKAKEDINKYTLNKDYLKENSIPEKDIAQVK